MKGFLRFLKVLIVIVALLALVIALPVLINLLFKLPAPSSICIAEWTAGDALGYYGAVLSFLGTVALSALALWQNYKINELNNKHTTLLEEMEREKNAPCFVIRNCIATGQISKLVIFVGNISNNVAQDVTFSDFSLLNESGIPLWKDKIEEHIHYLAPNAEHRIVVEIPALQDRLGYICFSINYTDVFGTTDKRDVVGMFEKDSNKICFCVKR